MPTVRRFIIDTNFFISAFEKEPANLTKFLEIIKGTNVRLYITNRILYELRWYLRRRLKEPLQVVEISFSDIKNIRKDLAKKGYKHSDFNDLSNIIAAKKFRASIVTSDLELIKICEALSIQVITSSAFVYMLMTNASGNHVKNFLYSLYDVILSDEIRHSIETQSLYDPVIRIKKIQEHALSVLKELKGTDAFEIKKENKLKFSKEESELLELVNEIGLEFPEFLQELERNNLETLKTELIEIYKELVDRSSELRVSLINENKNSIVLPIVSRLKARILFLLCAVEFNLVDIKALEAHLETLTEYAILYPGEIADFYMDIHFLRMIFFIITDNLERLRYYYTAKFHFLCEKEKRFDLLRLTRVIVLASTIITSGLIEKETTIESKDELSLLLQIGYLLLQTNQLEKAMLLLYHTFYLSYRLKDTTTLKGVLELLIVLHCAMNQPHSEELLEALEKAKDMGLYEFVATETKYELPSKHFEIREYVDIEQIRLEITDWYYIFHSAKEIRNKKEYSVLLLKNPYIPYTMAIYIPGYLPEHDIKIGRQIKIFQGQAKVFIPTTKKVHNFHVDLIIELKEGARYIFRGPFGIKII